MGGEFGGLLLLGLSSLGLDPGTENLPGLLGGFALAGALVVELEVDPAIGGVVTGLLADGARLAFGTLDGFDDGVTTRTVEEFVVDDQLQDFELVVKGGDWVCETDGWLGGLLGLGELGTELVVLGAGWAEGFVEQPLLVLVAAGEELRDGLLCHHLLG